MLVRNNSKSSSSFNDACSPKLGGSFFGALTVTVCIGLWSHAGYYHDNAFIFTDEALRERQQQSSPTTTPQTTTAGDDNDSSSSAGLVAVHIDTTSLSTTNDKQEDIDKETSSSLTTQIPSFYQLAKKHNTDKVRGSSTFEACMRNASECPRPDAINDGCKVTGHFYDSIYDKWLPRYMDEPLQFLEIGYFNGRGFDAFTDYFAVNNKAELHSLEISCLEPGERSEGKWPWGNFGAKNSHYQALRDDNKLHCGDASDYNFLNHTWMTYMNRTDAPPLRVVVEDASHLSQHMATSVFFWLPRIAPGGILVVEDIESQTQANKFRTDTLPQLIMDLHYCGLANEQKDGRKLCFPTLQPLIKSITCELHICVLERNEKPAIEYDRLQSMPTPNALDLMKCYNK